MPVVNASRLAAPAALLALLVAAPPSPAQAPAHSDAPPAVQLEKPRLVLDRAMRAEIIDSLVAQVGAHYVEADTAKMIGDAVRARARAGAYDAITDPFAFAEKVTKDMRTVNGDLHLGLRYDPSGGAPSGPTIVRRVVTSGPGGPGVPTGPEGPGGQRIVREGPGPGAPGAPAGGPGEPRIVIRGGPGDSAASDRIASSFFRQAREQNYGLTKLEILPGNIGYLEVSGFIGADGFEPVVGEAMKFLERTDAIIIDVRRNGGGAGEMSHLLFSHFLPEKPVATIRVKSREAREPITEESVADVPGPRRTDVPLYLLTSRATGSAAEEFSFVLKNQHRATLVGDRTAGAGHMVGGFSLPRGFMASVSLTRVSDPVTGREWEGVGVQPDVRVAPDQAPAVAHALALRALAEKAETPEKRRTLVRTAEVVEARAKPAAVDPGTLASMVGTYEGDRRVEVADGKPVIRLRPGAMGEELVPLPDGTFALLNTARLRFAPGAPSPSVTVERVDGSSSTYARVSAKAD